MKSRQPEPLVIIFVRTMMSVLAPSLGE